MQTYLQIMSRAFTDAELANQADDVSNAVFQAIVNHSDAYAEAIRAFVEGTRPEAVNELIDIYFTEVSNVTNLTQQVANYLKQDRDILQLYPSDMTLSSLVSTSVSSDTLESKYATIGELSTTNMTLGTAEMDNLSLNDHNVTITGGLIFIDDNVYPPPRETMIDTLWITGTLPRRELCDCDEFDLVLNGAPYYPIPDKCYVTHMSLALRASYTGTAQIDLVVNDVVYPLLGSTAIDSRDMFQRSGDLLIPLQRDDVISLRTTVGGGLKVDDCALSLKVVGTETQTVDISKPLPLPNY